ncbi:hypothetical protein AVEN_31109-1 [Araneus ventricosus]|uniref:Uncharacterized protein n=1 Tax=Araneus ventricosus TaxID=182803 RepID=A0A4Y2KRP4_ARAVE|nr:hypothetical protein AVEN_31109-1 [Araneus ventricosus]
MREQLKKYFLRISNTPLWLTKSAAVKHSQRKRQNGYLAAEGTSGMSLLPRKQIICNDLKMFSVVRETFTPELIIIIQFDNFDTLTENVFELLQLICFLGTRDVPDVPSTAR